MTSENADRNRDRIAQAFVTARRAGTVLEIYPGEFPAGLGAAYRVQDQAISLFDSKIGGWKVGRITPPVEGAERLAGPIFTDSIVHGAAPVAMPVLPGFAAAEAEFLLRIGTAPDPAKRDYTIAEAVELLDAVHIGIEIASSPFVGINDYGPIATISDFGNNHGLVVGLAIEDWRDQDLNGWLVELDINKQPVGSRTAATMLDGPLGAARFLFELMADRGIPLTPGQWISSGAVTGVHPVAAGDMVEARFGGKLTCRCSIATK